jgi:hypothetical protein
MRAYQRSQQFLTRWYLADIRGLPDTDEFNKFKSTLSSNLENAFTSAINKNKSLKDNAKNLAEPIPWNEGDFLTGIWEHPNSFEIVEFSEEKNEAKVIFSYTYDLDADSHEQKIITLHLVKNNGEWVVDNLFLDGDSLTDKLRRTMD